MDNNPYRYAAPATAPEIPQLPKTSNQHHSQATTVDGSSVEQRRGATISRFDSVPLTNFSGHQNFERSAPAIRATNNFAFPNTYPSNDVDRRALPYLVGNQLHGMPQQNPLAASNGLSYNTGTSFQPAPRRRIVEGRDSLQSDDLQQRSLHPTYNFQPHSATTYPLRQTDVDSAAYQESLTMPNTMGRRLLPRTTEVNMQAFDRPSVGTDSHPQRGMVPTMPPYSRRGLNALGLPQQRRSLPSNQAPESRATDLFSYTSPAGIDQSNPTTSNTGALQQSAASSSNTTASPVASFQRTTQDLLAGNFPLSFAGADQARSVAYPLPRVTVSGLGDDVNNVKTRQPEFVRQIMRAIDSHDYLVSQPVKRKAKATEAGKQGWTKYQTDHHTEARGTIEQDANRKFLEARSWMILEEIIKTHEEGALRIHCKGVPLSKCSDRLEAVIECLKELSIIRKLALNDMDIPRFVSNPKKYGFEKAKWQNTNNNRPTSRTKPPEGSRPASNRKRAAPEDDATGAVTNDVEANLPSKRQQRLNATGGSSRTRKAPRPGRQQDESNSQLRLSNSASNCGELNKFAANEEPAGSHLGAPDQRSAFGLPQMPYFDPTNSFQRDISSEQGGIALNNFDAAAGHVYGQFHIPAYDGSQLGDFPDRNDSVEASIRSSTYPAHQPFSENASFAPVGVAAVPGD